MIPIPTDTRELVSFANELIETCRVSQGNRAAYYRLLNQVAETGRPDGSKALINMMNSHLERTASHLFSPVELKFSYDFDNDYEGSVIKRGQVAAKHLTRAWEKNRIGTLFGQGVYEGLKYGASIMKQWPRAEGPEDKQRITYEQKLVRPWNFGVYRESESDIDKQEALCETSFLTGPEVWQRIWRFPNPKKLYQDIMVHASKGQSNDSGPDSFFHQVLSTSQISTGVQGATRPLPGGIVQLGNDPNYPTITPTDGAPTVKFHELWVKGEDDWKTIQIVEPDILITRFKLSNLLGIDGIHPYKLIQPNPMIDWFWGRSELIDLMEPQGFFAMLCDDLKRLIGLQIDKILAFKGDNTITDEAYGQFRMAGYVNLGQGGGVEDLTPKFPSELMSILKYLQEQINTLGNFPEVMQGKGESGVRAGAHADTLLKTASSVHRDSALLLEHQCASCADLTMTMMEAKEDRKFWTDPKDMEGTGFMLMDLPEDWRVTVDSHSSSPIFADEATQLLFQMRKTGDIDGEFLIDHTQVPDKETAKASLKQRKEAGEKMQKELFGQLSPEGKDKAIEKMLGGQHGGHH
jgi:hypothetical protein